MACKADNLISEYIGRNWSMEGNRKVDVIVEMLRLHNNIKQTRGRPVVLQWFDYNSLDSSILSDNSDTIIEKKINDDTIQTDASKVKIVSEMSDMSARNADDSKTIESEPQKCPDCGRTIDPFDKNTHPACCPGSGPSL